MPIGWLASLRRTSPMSEEELAAASLVLAVTAATGGMLVAIGWITGEPTPIAVPTVVLLVLMACHRAVASAWAAVGVWLLVLPMASGDGLLAPVLLAGLCATLAVGPERVAEFLFERGETTTPDETDGAEPAPPTGWIEDVDASVRP